MKQLTIDLETTGLSVYKDRIVQISMLQDINGYLRQKTMLFNPGIKISEGAMRVHNITNEMVKDKPPFSYYASMIKNIIEESDVILTYNGTNFDLPLLAFELLRCGYDLPKKVHIDVYSMISELERSKRLSDVYLRYTGSKMEGAHDAGNDTMATWEVYKKILEKLS